MDPRRWIAGYAMTRHELDRRDDITTQYSSKLRKWIVMDGAVMVAQFDDQSDANGAARRLCEGSE